VSSCCCAEPQKFPAQALLLLLLPPPPHCVVLQLAGCPALPWHCGWLGGEAAAAASTDPLDRSAHHPFIKVEQEVRICELSMDELGSKDGRAEGLTAGSIVADEPTDAFPSGVSVVVCDRRYGCTHGGC
jgi:hypothetical protein